MGNCGSSLNCGQCYSDNGEKGCLTEIEVDADIAGIGVLVAFFLAAFATCASIFYGYFTDSLPESLLFETDKDVIRYYERSAIARKFVPWMGRSLFSLKSFLYRCIGRPAPKLRAHVPREQRVEAVTRFLLGFSDQQLATGLAILIAVLANRCSLTVYELQIAFCLAWFSATTHMATLKVLQEYFYKNKVVRNWRVLGIFAFLVLLCFLQIILLLAGDPSDEAGYGVDFATPMQCVINARTQASKFSPFDVFTSVWVFVMLLYVYGLHTYLLFQDPRMRNHRSADTHYQPLWTLRSSKYGALSPEQRQRLSQNVNLQYNMLLSPVVSSALVPGPHGFARFYNSFLCYIPTIIFSMTYGISQSVFVRWYKPPKTTDDIRRMGFGQVVALALLIIPILAACEIYNEARDLAVKIDIVHQQSTEIAGTTSNVETNSNVEETPSSGPSSNSELQEESQANLESRALSISSDHALVNSLCAELDQILATRGELHTVDPERRLSIVLDLIFFFYRHKGTSWTEKTTSDKVSMRKRSSTRILRTFACKTVTEVFTAISFWSTATGVQLTGIAFIMLWVCLESFTWIKEATLKRNLFKDQIRRLKEVDVDGNVPSAILESVVIPNSAPSQ